MNRTRPHTLVAAALLSLLAGCAGTDDKSVATAQAREVENPHEVTCKNIVKTGTRIGTRVCKTNAAWAAAEDRGRAMLEDTQRRSTHGQTYQTEGGN